MNRTGQGADAEVVSVAVCTILQARVSTRPGMQKPTTGSQLGALCRHAQANGCLPSARSTGVEFYSGEWRKHL